MEKTTQPSLTAHLWKHVKPVFRPWHKRIRGSFTGLLWFIGLDLALREWQQVPVAVEPLLSTAGSVAEYGDMASLKAGTMIIHHPNLVTLLFADHAGNGASLFNLLMMTVVSIIIIVIAPKLSDQDLFRKDISRSIQWIGALIITHGLLTMYGVIQLSDMIKIMTRGQYTEASHGFNSMLYAELYVGVLIIAAGRWYRQGVRMRQEQDLTI